MNDNNIAQFIKAKKHTRLAFLESDAEQASNENYLGFYYFSLEAQGKSTDDALRKITEVQGDISNAYVYLGVIAQKVFADPSERYIARYFYKQAIECNGNNAQAWWHLYKVDTQPSQLLKALSIDYGNEDFTSINHKLRIMGSPWKALDTLGINELNSLVDILSHHHIERRYGDRFLVASLYQLKRYDEAKACLTEIQQLSATELRLYIDAQLITQAEASHKVYDFEVEKLLGDNHSLIYQELAKRDAEGQLKHYPDQPAQAAFRAKAYTEIIELYTKQLMESDKRVPNTNMQLYYLLSLLFLEKPIDPELFATLRAQNLDNALWDIVVFKNHIQALKDQWKDDKTNNTLLPIAHWTQYQQLSDKLNNDERLLGHFLYDGLHQELTQLQSHANRVYMDTQLQLVKEKIASTDAQLGDFTDYFYYAMEVGHHQEVYNKVQELHREHAPSMTTHNMLGVCCERQDRWQEAFEHYSQALDEMEKLNEPSHTVIANYLHAAKKSGNDLSPNSYARLRKTLNDALVSEFRWSRTLADTDNRLYKYSPFNLNTLDSLLNQYFYLPKKAQLNDPIEMPTIANIGEAHLIDSDFRICSFSQNSNSVLMWSHYTENHQGIMVEYQFGHGAPFGCGIAEVQYKNMKRRHIEREDYIFNQFLLTKNKEWEYEKEIRLLSHGQDKVFYDGYDYPNPDTSKLNVYVTSITLGCNFPESKIDLVTNLVHGLNVKRKAHQPEIRLRQARISDDNVFGIEYHPIQR